MSDEILIQQNCGSFMWCVFSVLYKYMQCFPITDFRRVFSC